MFAAGPLHFDGLGSAGPAESKIRPQVALREIASPASDLTNLRDACHRELDTSAHRVPIALHAHQFEVKEVISIAPTVV